MKWRFSPLDDVFSETLLSLDDVNCTWAGAMRVLIFALYGAFRAFLLAIIRACRRHSDRLVRRRCRRLARRWHRYFDPRGRCK
jgi:hypothetical protein